MIDTFYRIKALHELGIQIHLHCFEYGRDNPEVLASFCKSVNYYPRIRGIKGHMSIIPHVVKSRKSEMLLQNLTADNHPILFDGLHTTFYLGHPSLAGRKKFVRVHNIEHRYYVNLAKHERKIVFKLYYLAESWRLRFYEKKLKKADIIFPISPGDHLHFAAKFKSLKLLLPFFPLNNLACQAGSGDYIIYHGNLWLNENNAVCEFLIEEIFSKVPFSFIIAGKSPSVKLKSKVSHYKNITIIPDPDERQMLGLISNAHINLIPAKGSNGFKLKLLIALFAGRHCLTNTMMLKGTGLHSLCHIADDSQSIVGKIHSLMEQSFTEEMITFRSSILSETYSNVKNAELLASSVFKE